MSLALSGWLTLLLLSRCGVPVAMAMVMTGVAGLALITPGALPEQIGLVLMGTSLNPLIAAIALFSLMGHLCQRAGLADDLYAAIAGRLGHRPGGLTLAGVLASGAFGGLCGSSMTTALATSATAYPRMQAEGYRESLATGALASGSAIASLWPPSSTLLLYAVVTGTSPSALFTAALVPGLLALAGLCVTVVIVAWRDPSAGPALPGLPATLAQTLRSLLTPLVLLVLPMGGLLSRTFSPVEAAALGAAAALLLASWRRRMTPRGLMECLLESVQTTAVLFTFAVGSLWLMAFLAATGLPDWLADTVSAAASPTAAALLVALLTAFALCWLRHPLAEALAGLGLLVPAMTAAGAHPVWLGVLFATWVALGSVLSPGRPVPAVLQRRWPGMSQVALQQGLRPFALSLALLGFWLLACPWLALYLPALRA